MTKLYGIGFLLCSFIYMNVNSQPIVNKPTSQITVDSVSIPPLEWDYDAHARINYVRTRQAAGPINDKATFNNASYIDVKESTEYMDGLGLPFQSVNRQFSPGAYDMVSPVTYDTFNRQVYHYLPYRAKYDEGAISFDDGKYKPYYQRDQFSFFNDTALNPGINGEYYYYSKTNFEASPLNRVLKEMPPGNKWVGSERGIEYKYLVNTHEDSVRLWSIGLDTLTYLDNDTATNMPVSTSLYDTGQLYKSVVVDENGNATVEYKDLDGLVVLKKGQIGNIATDYSGYAGFLCTYYIYDDFNSLRFVIQPKAVAALLISNWQLSGALTNELCFRYEYDERGRIIAKKVPGAGWVYMVYDGRDRMVFTQDANMRTSNQWLATLYDELNRPVTTGIFTYSGTLSDLQIYVSGVPTGSSANERVVFNTSALQTNLTVNVPVPVPMTLEAKKTVVLNPGFQTVSHTPVLVKISNASGKADSAIICGNPLPVPIDSLIVLTNTYYDDYSWSPLITYNESYINKLDTGNNLHAEAVPILEEQQKVFTKGLITISRVRVIENPDSLSIGEFLTNTSFYDDRGRLLQTQSDNYKTGKDIVTNRFDFTGNVLCNYVAHSNPAAGTVLKVKTSMDYDHAGRLLKVWKTINDDSTGRKLITNNSYDELGRVNKKELGCIDSAAIETLDYTYNIRGWLRAINHDYTNNANNDHWFGEELSYDWGFDSAQYNGNIAGVKWRTKGFIFPLSYGYTYDQSNRLLGAFMGLGLGSTGFVDYPYYQVQMGDGRDANTAYDENGNIKAMKQWAWQAQAIGIMDNMTYNYSPGSNKLLNIIDSAADYKLKDFHTSKLHPDFDNKTSTTVDYTYDENGNLLKDLNKDIGTASVSGIQYNYMNLPYKVTVYDSAGKKGEIVYIYDAVGNKLEKRVTETGHPDNRTTYIGPCIYENDKLQFFSHEEGRTRYAKKYFVNGDSAYQFVQDYFVKDHLGNIRLVLTEQKDTASYFATMETPYRVKEDALFSHVTSTAYPDSLVPGGYPTDTTITNPNAYVSRLNASDNKIGPSIVLKVMAGDKVDIGVKSFYRPNGSPGGNTDITETIIESLYTELLNTLGTTKGYLGDPANPTTIMEGLYDIINFRNSNNPEISGKPKAFLNWVLFDEHFVMVDSYPQCGAIPVGEADILNTLAQNDIDVTRNGYLYVYLSNDTESWDVFFDNLAVNHRTGPLLEETHYYPFGLTMAGISAKALKSKDCGCDIKRGFNGNELQQKEFVDGSGLDVYDFNSRTYNQQTGRFLQIDPTPEDGDQESLTPYQFSGNNPSTFNDPSGKCPWCLGAIIGAAVEYGTQVATNLAQGKSLGESLTDVKGGQILIAAGAGALSGGLSALAPKTTLAKVVVEGSKILVGAGESAAKQYNESGKIDPAKVVTDVGANVIGDVATKNIKINSSSTIKTTEKQLDRAQRIATADPASSGRAATVKKMENKVSSQKAANANAQQAAGGATSNTVQAGVDAARNSNNFKPMPSYNPDKPLVDNTAVNKVLPKF